MMNIFLLGGWAARPTAFYFLRRRWFIVLFCFALPFVVALLCSATLNRVFHCLILFFVARSLFPALPASSMPSISASLGSRYPYNQKTRLAYLCTFCSLGCIVMQRLI